MSGPSSLRWSLLPRRLMVGAVRVYRILLSPWLGNACRFEPTCSAYAVQAVETYGILRGGILASWRLLRCNPWSHGGYDPVGAQTLFESRPTHGNSPASHR